MSKEEPDIIVGESWSSCGLKKANDRVFAQIEHIIYGIKV